MSQTLIHENLLLFNDTRITYESYVAFRTRILYTCLNTESKRERFKRLAAHRTNEVLYRLKVLGNCSNRQLYDYTEKEIEKIFSEIEKKLKETKSKFHFSKKEDKFSL